MNRRQWLALLGGAGAINSTGCLSSGSEGCPVPSLQNELEYEQRSPTAVFKTGDEGIRLVSSSAEVDRFDSDYLESEIAQWARDSQFNEQVVLGIQVGSSGESSSLKVLGVEREDDGSIHAYSCIERKGATDDWVPNAGVLRVPFEEKRPETATLTHWEAGEKRVFD